MLIRENSKIVLPTGLKKEYNSYPQTYVKTFGLTYFAATYACKTNA